MSIYTTGAYWSATAERAVKTFAQTELAAIGVGQVTLGSLDWSTVLSVGAVATILSVLTSLACAGVGGVGPSLTTAEQLAPAAAGGVSSFPQAGGEL